MKITGTNMKSDIELKIDEIGREMATQDNRATQYPMYAVMQDYEVPSYWRGEADHQERREEVEADLLCDECKKLYFDDEDLPGKCDECDEDAFVYFNIERRLCVEMCGVFFTAKACQEHIDANRYHYNNPSVYGIGSWRNPEMQTVQKYLINKTESSMPPHYE